MILSAPDLANSVTSFCTIGAGLTTLALCRWVAPQPARWWRVYLAILITGIPTLGWHGWGTSLWQVADIGTNLLLAYSIQLAVLGDFYSLRTQRVVGIGSALLNLVAVLQLGWEKLGGEVRYAIDFGSFGGFYVGEAVLILDAFAIVGLMYARGDRIAPAAKPLLTLVVGCFLVGLALATAAGDVVHGRIWSYHAIWHVVGAFGFILFWGFNHVRFHGAGGEIHG